MRLQSAGIYILCTSHPGHSQPLPRACLRLLQGDTPPRTHCRWQRPAVLSTQLFGCPPSRPCGPGPFLVSPAGSSTPLSLCSARMFPGEHRARMRKLMSFLKLFSHQKDEGRVANRTRDSPCVRGKADSAGSSPPPRRAGRPTPVKRSRASVASVTPTLATAWECLPFALQPGAQRRPRASRAAYVVENKTTTSPPLGFRLFYEGRCGSA